MTTVAVPIEITCPDWCVETAEHHASQIWDLGGCCDHRSGRIVAEDAAGYLTEPLAALKHHDPVEVQLLALTAPDGNPQATPLLLVDDHEMTLQQAVDLGALLCSQVLRYFETTETPKVSDDGLLHQMIDLLEEVRDAAALVVQREQA